MKSQPAPHVNGRRSHEAEPAELAAMPGASHNAVRPIIIQGHTRPLTMVKYNREGDLLFTCAKDHTPSVWYADNGERIGTYEGHNGTVWCIDVNFDSTRLLTGGADNMCKLWNVETGQCLNTWKHTAPVRDARFAMGDKRFLTVLDNIMGNIATIFVWELDLKDLANTPDCPTLTITGHTNKVLRALWGPINRSIFSASDDTTIRVWSPETGEQKGIVEGVHTKRITDMQFSWDMTLIVTSCADHYVRLFEASSLTLLKMFNTERNINSAAVSPLASCPYIIAAGGQDAMSVTTTAAKQGNFHTSFYDHVFDDELGFLQGHFGPVNTLAFAPHGRAYTSGGEEGYVRIHNLPQEYFDSFNRKVAQANGKDWP
jgi:translation initiation factor 3 subunit I